MGSRPHPGTNREFLLQQEEKDNLCVSGSEATQVWWCGYLAEGKEGETVLQNEMEKTKRQRELVKEKFCREEGGLGRTTTDLASSKYKGRSQVQTGPLKALDSSLHNTACGEESNPDQESWIMVLVNKIMRAGWEFSSSCSIVTF